MLVSGRAYRVTEWSQSTEKLIFLKENVTNIKRNKGMRFSLLLLR